MNTNEDQTEPLPVQPGSYSADVPAASVEEKFAALFRQVHPPVTTWEQSTASRPQSVLETAQREVEIVSGMSAGMMV
jgi:hypothetical protein